VTSKRWQIKVCHLIAQSMPSPYEILGLPLNATESEVRQARRKLIFDLHADRLPKELPEGAAKLINEKVLEINWAYEEIMKKFDERKIYSHEKTSSPREQGSASSAQAGTGNEGSEHRQENASSKSDENSASNPAKASNADKARTTRRNPIAQIIGVLIGILLMQTCRQAINNTKHEFSHESTISQIINSQNDYCPELIKSITEGKDSSDNIELKLLSEMKRNAPEGSAYSSEVSSVIQALKGNSPVNKDATRDAMKKLISNYFPLVCDGELQIAKLQSEDPTKYYSLKDAPPKSLQVFANAFCSALQANEALDSEDKQRSVGAIYIGRELDRLPKDERESIRREMVRGLSDQAWMQQGVVALVKQCPDFAYRFIEN
jgi:curved DNA-binding protein CbpA